MSPAAHRLHRGAAGAPQREPTALASLTTRATREQTTGLDSVPIAHLPGAGTNCPFLIGDADGDLRLRAGIPMLPVQQPRRSGNQV
jgi:hypothetical protein